jgi:tetratricopeptide (TPR) repeat protein
LNALCPTGRIGTPKDISELALELNPSNSAANQDPAMAITSFGRYDEALIYLQKAIDLDPSGRSKYEGYLPLIYLGMKDAENAKRWITLFRDKMAIVGGMVGWRLLRRTVATWKTQKNPLPCFLKSG